MIMQARVKAGWISEADLAKPPDGRERRQTADRRQHGLTHAGSDATRTDAGADERRAQRGRAAVRRDARGQADRCELIRFVVGPDGEVVPDLKRKLPGRGVWVDRDARGAGRGGPAQGVFARGFKRARSRVPPISSSRPSGCCERAALDALAIAGKAGAGGRPVSPRSRRRWRDGQVAGRRSMRPTRRRTACASSSRPCAADSAAMRDKSRSSLHSRRRNWIWHWAGQM